MLFNLYFYIFFRERKQWQEYPFVVQRFRKWFWQSWAVEWLDRKHFRERKNFGAEKRFGTQPYHTKHQIKTKITLFMNIISSLKVNQIAARKCIDKAREEFVRDWLHLKKNLDSDVLTWIKRSKSTQEKLKGFRKIYQNFKVSSVWWDNDSSINRRDILHLMDLVHVRQSDSKRTKYNDHWIK